MQITRQHDIEAGRDVAGRDINNVTNYLPTPRNQISILYDRLKAEAAISNDEVKSLIEDLQHYIDKPATQITRSLSDKLIDTDRADLVESAEVAKERAMKRIMQFQSSQTAQEIFAYTLGDLHSRFNHHVRPLIAAGSSRAIIDAATFQHVLNPVVASAEPSALGVNPALAEALLYFLAGNCHIKWD